MSTNNLSIEKSEPEILASPLPTAASVEAYLNHWATRIRSLTKSELTVTAHPKDDGKVAYCVTVWEGPKPTTVHANSFGELYTLVRETLGKGLEARLKRAAELRRQADELERGAA